MYITESEASENTQRIMGHIRACLTHHGVTNQTAAEWCGMSEDEMREQLTTGKMSVEYLSVFIDRLNIDIAELVGYKGDA